MAPVNNNSPEKSKCPRKTKIKIKRINRKSLKRKKTELTDSEYEDMSETANYDLVIEDKVNAAVDNILETITKRR